MIKINTFSVLVYDIFWPNRSVRYDINSIDANSYDHIIIFLTFSHTIEMSTQWWKIHPCISLSKRKKFPKKKRKYIYICVCVCVGGCVCRAIHRLGRSSLCPTRSRLVGDRVGRCQTRNLPVLGSGFTGRFPVGGVRFWVRPKPAGEDEKSRKLARSLLIRPRSGAI